MNRSGPGGQPLRGMAGNAFAGQLNANTRSTPLGSGRLQNTKLGTGSGSGWGNYSGMAGGPVSSSRVPSSGPGGFPSSFAQTIGSTQNQAPLDLSEFPSLSGGPQPSSSATPAVWNNSASLRTAQSLNQQRHVGPSSSSQPQAQDQQQNIMTFRSSRTEHSDDMQDNTFMDRFQFGGQRQPTQQGSAEDFPPLGGLGAGEIGVARRTTSGQGAPMNTLLGRMGDGAQTDGNTEGEGLNNSVALGSASRSQLEALQVDHDGSSRLSHSNSQPRGVPIRSSETKAISGAPPARGTAEPGAKATGRAPQAQSKDASVSELDRYGFQGFLDKIQGGTDQAGLAWGLDLNTLGLDLGRIDGSPLYRDWAGPFADSTQRGVIPVFQLPPAYTIQNVPPLENKIGSFSDETLFAIFYQCPRDVAQDMAAHELYQRDWRWHKKLQQWMMKAKEFGEPQMLPSMKEERGYYYFFDANNWRRERKEFILNYEHLYHGQVQAPAP